MGGLIASDNSLQIVEKQPLEEAKKLNSQGLLLATGCDVPQDHRLALLFFKKAAQLGDIDALYNLAIAYEYGLGVAVDLALAMEYQLKAAQQGSDRPEIFFKDWAAFKGSPPEFFESCLADCQNDFEKLYYVGCCFETGLLGSVDYQRARQYYQMASDQGSDNAQHRLGYLFEHGLSVPRDIIRAFDWYRLATQNFGSRKARFDLGRCYRQGIGCFPNFTKANKWLKTLLPIDYRPAVYEYVALAEAGFAPAQAYLGHRYLRDLDDETIQQNDQQSLYWLQLAAKQQDRNAIYDLGLHFLCGRSDENFQKTQDPLLPLTHYKMAFEQFLKSAELGHVLGLRRVAFAYRDGKGVARDYAQALHWFHKAVEQGSQEAAASIGFLYFNGLGVAKDYSAAFDWFSQAARREAPRGYYGLGLLYEKGYGVQQSYLKAIRWYQNAQWGGLALAFAKLDFFSAQGIGDYPYRFKSVPFDQYVVQKGDFDALFYAAVWLQSTDKSDHRVIKYYRLAAESGHPGAQNNLGILFEEGKGFQQDYQQAFQWYQAAAKRGNCTAQFNVGRCYQLGQRTSQKELQVFEHYWQAARHQCLEASNNLGVCFALKYYSNTRDKLQQQIASRYFTCDAKIVCSVAENNLNVLQTNGPEEDFVSFLQPLADPSRSFQTITADNQKVIQLFACQENQAILEQDYFL